MTDSEGSSQFVSPKKSTPKIKKILRLVTLSAVIFFIALQLLVHYRATRPVVVRLKSDGERARIPLSQDVYPCLKVRRSPGSKRLQVNLEQCSLSLNNDADIEEYEVDLRSGLFILRQTDLFVTDSVPLALTRAYRLWDGHSRAFGVGSNHSYDIFPVGDHFPYTYTDLVLADVTVHYDRISEGTSYVDFVADHRGNEATVFQNSRIQWNRDHWDLKFKDGMLFQFPEAYMAPRGVIGALTAMRYADGSEIGLVRDARHNLKQLSSPHKHQIQFAYDAGDRVVAANDDQGRHVGYRYDQNGRLVEVSGNDGILWRYTYDLIGMTSVENAEGKDILSNRYAKGRIASVTILDEGTYSFEYLFSKPGKVGETIVTDPAGNTKRFRF